VRRRWLKPLLYWLIALQLLLSATVVSALTSHGTGCAQIGDHCPCCPDGVVSTADCLSACTAASAPPPVSNLTVTVAARSEAPVQASTRLEQPGEPPLKPPPIR